MNIKGRLLQLRLVKLILLRKKKDDDVITARDIKKYIFDKECVPTPIYTKGAEKRYYKSKKKPLRF